VVGRERPPRHIDSSASDMEDKRTAPSLLVRGFLYFLDKEAKRSKSIGHVLLQKLIKVR
jgi:hypothetical protein